jgi:hypothetical protein
MVFRAKAQVSIGGGAPLVTFIAPLRGAYAIVIVWSGGSRLVGDSPPATNPARPFGVRCRPSALLLNYHPTLHHTAHPLRHPDVLKRIARHRT